MMWSKLLLIIEFIFVISLHAKGTEVKVINLSVENIYGYSLYDVPVVLDIAKFNLKKCVRSAIVTESDYEIPVQLDDLNQDGIIDEIVFLTNLKPNESKKFCVSLSNKKTETKYTSRVFAELLLKDDSDGINKHITSITAPGNSNIYSLLYHHGPALESELVAYRLYFNDLQTPDIYGKFNKGFEIKESQFYPSDEQLAKGFGDDVLRVFDTCGAGGFRGWNGKEATPISPVATRTESILAYGPLRAVAEIKVKDWNYGGEAINATMRYTLYAGHRDLHIEVFFSKIDSSVSFATGIQNIKDSEFLKGDHELLGCWGTDWPVNDTIKYKKETVGLGLYVPKKYVKSQHSDNKNYLFVVSPENNYLEYYVTFKSGKERWWKICYDEWFNYLKKWKVILEKGVKIEYIE